MFPQGTAHGRGGRSSRCCSKDVSGEIGSKVFQNVERSSRSSKRASSWPFRARHFPTIAPGTHLDKSARDSRTTRNWDSRTRIASSSPRTPRRDVAELDGRSRAYTNPHVSELLFDAHRRRTTRAPLRVARPPRQVHQRTAAGLPNTLTIMEVVVSWPTRMEPDRDLVW